MTTTLIVEEPGLATTLQDGGRWGYQRYGVPVSGALDAANLQLANHLVAMPPATPALEVRLAGPTLRAEGGSCRIALTGTRGGWSVTRANGDVDRAPAYRSLTLAPGDAVTVPALEASSVGYLAVAGGFRVEPVLGSASTYARSGLGGFAGRPLRTGDRLELLDPDYGAGDLSLASDWLDQPDRIRVVLGPQENGFTKAAVATFFEADWLITMDADRMGMRLSGPELTHAGDFNIVSDGIATGAIQVPGSKQPIVLLADRQTTGGYPKIATVISVDLGALSRRRPGDHVRFEAVDQDRAVSIARSTAARLEALARSAVSVPPLGQVDSQRLLADNLISGVWGVEHD